MSKPSFVGQAAPVEILAEWEGLAVPGSWAGFEEGEADHLGVTEDVAGLVAWLAATALGGVVGNSAYSAVRAKALGVLAAVRRRLGQVKIGEVKQQLLAEMQKYRLNARITDEELRERIDLLFREIQA
jgi:hypothetical protein